jgi:chromate transporter
VLFREVGEFRWGAVRVLVPAGGSADLMAMLFAVVALALLAWRGWGMLAVLGVAAGAGMVLSLVSA